MFWQNDVDVDMLLSAQDNLVANINDINEICYSILSSHIYIIDTRKHVSE